MADHVVHISKAEAAGNLADLLARLRRRGNRDRERPAACDGDPCACPTARTISECIAPLPEDSTAAMDADFAKDVEAAIESHREPLEPPAWDESSIPAF